MELTREEKEFILQVFATITIKASAPDAVEITRNIAVITAKLNAPEVAAEEAKAAKGK